MRYRSFPKIPHLQTSILGFGCMRLPTLNGDPARIDEESASRLLHEAIDAGVNYLDTAWPYHAGQSESFVGRALAGGWREKVQLATKSPVWLAQTPSDWERFLDQQLTKLQTDRIDFYLLHALDADRWQHVQRLRGLDALERARADGRIGHVGFSFHGSADEFRKIVDGYDWEFCQIQLNFLDEDYQAGLEGLRYASARDVGVVVMEPLRGGALARPSPAIQNIWARSDKPWSPAEWALRWIWEQPGVVTVLSGMNAANQLRDNVQAAASEGTLGAGELALVDEAKRVYRARMRVPCTTCGYCQPCPNGVSIPDVFSNYNAAAMFDSKEGPAATYRQWVLGAGAGADQCTGCAECEPKCPQHIGIVKALEEAHAHLVGE